MAGRADDATLAEELKAAELSEYALVLDEVYAAFDEHSKAHRYEPAIFLARSMHSDALRRGDAYARTRIWAASTLGLVQTRAARHADAEETVSEEITRVRGDLARLTAGAGWPDLSPEERGGWREALRLDLVGLHDRRALARIGAGRTSEALSDLGAALAGGSRDAALVLGRLALREGNPARARRLLGSLLDEAGGEAWARRGWGLTMLP